MIPNLKAEAAEFAMADRQAGHGDEEAEETVQKYAGGAYQAMERALSAAKAAVAANAASKRIAITVADDGMEAADKLVWTAEHSVHDIHNSAEKAHDAIRAGLTTSRRLWS